MVVERGVEPLVERGDAERLRLSDDLIDAHLFRDAERRYVLRPPIAARAVISPSPPPPGRGLMMIVGVVSPGCVTLSGLVSQTELMGVFWSLSK